MEGRGRKERVVRDKWGRRRRRQGKVEGRKGRKDEV